MRGSAGRRLRPTHTLFSAVSYLFADPQTAIDNRDSLGNRN
jgi:hypothetical protein